MISASTGGGVPGNHAAATEPWTTRTDSPTPLPRTSKATRLEPVPATSTSRNAPLGSPSMRLVDHTFPVDRKSTRLNSSHANISYAVFCLKKKNEDQTT